MIRQIRAAAMEMQEMEDGEAQQKLMQEKLLPLYQQFVLERVTVRLEDASLTNKLIAIAAERQGAQPDQLKLQMAMIAPAFLASYVPAELAQQVGQALQTYLDDPQSLTISLAPPKRHDDRRHHGEGARPIRPRLRPFSAPR